MAITSDAVIQTTTYVGKLMSQFIEMYNRTKMLNAPSLYEVVLRHGKEMLPEPLSVSQARYIVKLARRVGPGLNGFRVKECYMNSQRMITRDMSDRLQYCEGYVAWDNGPLPVDHAWLLLDGKVVDLTLRAKSKTERHSYCGVVIPRRLMMQTMNKTQRYGSVLEGPYQHKVFPEETRKQK